MRMQSTILARCGSASDGSMLHEPSLANVKRRLHFRLKMRECSRIRVLFLFVSRFGNQQRPHDLAGAVSAAGEEQSGDDGGGASKL